MDQSAASSTSHLQRRLLHRHLAEDPRPVVRTHRLQLVLVEGEELSSSQDAQAGDGAEHGTETHGQRWSSTGPGLCEGVLTCR